MGKRVGFFDRLRFFWWLGVLKSVRKNQKVLNERELFASKRVGELNKLVNG